MAGPELFVNDSISARLPNCCGVYRFYSGENILLYVGKSVDVAKRVRSHFLEARRRPRHARLMNSVERITCRPTAGELGALLLESRAVKEELPLYNRRLRRTRQLWSIYPQRAANGYLQPLAQVFNDRSRNPGIGYGIFRSQLQARNSLFSICEANQLCPRVLGFDRGKGPCFQYQLGRCRGACDGRESSHAHNERLLQALDKLKIAAWPYDHPILLHEVSNSSCPGTPSEEWHLIDSWAYMGTWDTAHEALGAVNTIANAAFDRDAYQILTKGIQSRQIKAYRFDSTLRLAEPMNSLDELEHIV